MIDAIALVLLSSATFVGAIYVNKPANARRNDRAEIKRRLLSVLIASALISSLAYFYKHVPLGMHMTEFARRIAAPVCHVIVLFAGPLTVKYSYGEKLIELSGLQFVRDVVYAPVVEELVFRVVHCGLLTQAGVSMRWNIVITAIVFGAMHAHHVVEHVFVESVPVKRALKGAVFQFSFTALFGAYAAFIYLKTQSFWAVALIHAFCNNMGVPDVSEASNFPISHWLGLIAFLLILCFA